MIVGAMGLKAAKLTEAPTGLVTNRQASLRLALPPPLILATNNDLQKAHQCQVRGFGNDQGATLVSEKVAAHLN